MKKISGIILILPMLFIGGFFPVHGQVFPKVSEKTIWEVDFEPFAGFTYGHIGEYISGVDTSDTISHLTWEEKPLWTLGFKSDGKYKNFRAGIYFDAALPLRCGKMEDSDWTDGLNVTDTKTIYSVHEQSVKTLLHTGLKLSYEIPIRKRLTLEPQIEASFFHAAFKAKNGYGWYGATASYKGNGAYSYWRHGTYYEKGRLYGIDYLQQTFFLFTGISVGVSINSRISAEIFGGISPYTYTYVKDTHYGKSSESHQEHFFSANFKRYRAGLSLSYKLNETLSLTGGISGLWGGKITGDLYSDKNIDKMKIIPTQKAGSDIYEYTITTGCKIKLF